MEHARDRQQPLVYSCAEDSYRQTVLTGSNRGRFLSTPNIKENALCGILPLSIGMKVVLTVNICTDDGLANGAQGILRKIVYNRDSIDHSASQQGKIIAIKNPPKYVVIEMLGKSPGVYKGLPLNHVPVYPIKRILSGDTMELEYKEGFSASNFL